MPTTRRSTGGARARQGPTKGQSTISFASSVTKAIPKDIKNNVISAPIRTKVEVTEPVVKDVVEEEEQDDDEEEDEEPEKPSVQPTEEKSKEEQLAEDITDAQVNKYWKSIESERKAPRVHQEGLSTNEKLLRYFDVSSQYGPCIGIPRKKRWERAHRLGLNPPLEVLAVLLKETSKGNKTVQVTEIDQILNSSAAVEA
ncbi:hypothetical protein VHEMI00160 [[Torrubiella] hemipterigena]|uniref:DNA polymerase delta subunit 4 n=1 Tax=[Torrubiella] hemipterigena TaxID=1531966 RepID=A0A0A1SIG9_9HYPO|nr:hypothetical protein VHEMI00160 [[Torrubiella] hemipterigena]